MTDGPISIEQVEPETERTAILRVLKDNLPEAATKGRFDWAYLQNPHGVARVWLARTARREPIATSAAFPRLFRVSGAPVRALVLSDFAVDARFRTLGPALKLLRATLSPVDAGEFEFALDHPSESMAAVYRRLGGTGLGLQVRMVRLLKVSGLVRRRWGTGPLANALGRAGNIVLGARDSLRRLPPGLSAGNHEEAFDASFATAAEALRSRCAVVGERSPEYLNWRFRSGIRFAFATVTVRASGNLAAYAILQFAPDQTATLVEFVSPADAAMERALLAAVVAYCRRRDIESIQASGVAKGTWHSLLQNLGFAARECQSGPVVYAPKDRELASILAAGESWWMTDGDRDG